MGVGCLLTVAMHLRVATNPGLVPADSADRLLQSWQVAWNGHALVHQPGDFFDANAFWPLENSAAFTDALVGLAPAGLVGSGPEAAVVRYNLLFLLSYAGGFVAAALLARELGAGWGAAAVAGAAFAFAPWRLSHHNHLHVLASAPIPLSLFLLLRGWRSLRPGLVLAGFAVATWQVAIGFTLGVPLVYLLGAAGLVAGVWWFRAGRRTPNRSLAAATAAGVVLLGGWSALQAQPFLDVVDQHPEAQRPASVVQFYSPPPRAYLIAPPDSLVWGDATRGLRASVDWAPEMALFPGLAVLGLAVVGVAGPAYPRPVRALLVLAAAGTAILALGYRFLGGRFTYDLLYDWAPGWQASRTPGRLFTLTSLALALLAAAGVTAISRRFSARGRGGGAWESRLIAALALALVLVEGLGTPPDLAEPPIRGLPETGPQLHLPSSEFDDLAYMYWSTDGFVPIVNGYSAFTPALLTRAREETASFPDEPSVEWLRDLGVETVVLHLDRVAGTGWEGAAGKPVDGLGLTARPEGATLVYRLDPGDGS